MENLIIILILAVIIVLGVKSSIKHFKGQGGCCGGSSEKRPKKKLGNVIAKRIFTVEGMTCEHCRNRVERCINEIDGAAAKVSLGKKEAVISLEKEVSDEVLKEAVEKAGYQVTAIR